MCTVCESTLSDNRSYDLSRHYKKHQAKTEEKTKVSAWLSYGKNMW